MSSKYRRDLAVDKYRLDEELIQQPQKFMDYVELYADAAGEKDDALDHLDITKAQIEDLVRTSPEEFGLDENPKEAAIKSAIVKHPKVRRANKELRKCKKTLKILEGAKQSFEQRKTMLSKLVDLKIGGFYSEVKVRRSTREREDRQTSKELKQQLNKRRRIKRR